MNNEVLLKSNEEKIIIHDFNNETKEQVFELEENSHLVYITFQHGNNTNLNNKLIANLKKDAYLEIYNIVTSDLISEINQIINLNDFGANVEIINLLLLTKNATLDSKIEVFHKEKHTSSNLSNYAIAKDEAKIILDNNATIKKGCSSSLAHQSTKGLTLSKSTKIKALPNLYIDEYDVIASHACSIGSINKEDLFYLMSRGMTQEEASKIIVMGYVKPILDHIKDELVKKEVQKEFETYILN